MNRSRDLLVIFDLDGTLWDSARPVADSWNLVLSREDPSLPPLTTEDIHAVMGLTMTEIATRLQPALADDRRAELFQECSVFEVAYLRDHPGDLFPEAEAVLSSLRDAGFPLAIVSNCQRGYVDAFLQGTGLREFFLDWEEWERTGLTKGENIRLVMERNGFSRAVYIGDTRKDEEAADFAGIPFIHAAYGFGTADHPAAVLHALPELPAVLAALRCRPECAGSEGSRP